MVALSDRQWPEDLIDIPEVKEDVPDEVSFEWFVSPYTKPYGHKITLPAFMTAVVLYCATSFVVEHNRRLDLHAVMGNETIRCR